MDQHPFRVRRIYSLTEELKLFILDGGIDARPGQFVFASVPGKGEKPLSLAGCSPVSMVVRRVGPFTSRLFELKEGDALLLRDLTEGLFLLSMRSSVSWRRHRPWPGGFCSPAGQESRAFCRSPQLEGTADY